MTKADFSKQTNNNTNLYCNSIKYPFKLQDKNYLNNILQKQVSVGVIDTFDTHDSSKMNHGMIMSHVVEKLNPLAIINSYPCECTTTLITDIGNYYSKLITSMVKNDNIKVINLSAGLNYLNVIANNCLKYNSDFKPKMSPEVAQLTINTINLILEDTLSNLIDNGYDFIIVKDAGTNSNTPILQINSFKWGFTFLDSATIPVCIGEPVLKTKTPTLDPTLDFFSGIKDPKVKDRILVVGSANITDNDEYELSKHCNFNDRVDILAPIGSICDIDNAYNIPIEAPVVSSLCSILYQIRPSLKGNEIKELIINNSNTLVLNTSKKMVNFTATINSIL